jgi:hypothetical protein
MTTDVKAPHPAKARSPMLLTDAGKDIDRSFQQSKNALLPMDTTEGGSKRVSSDQHELKAP